MESLSFLVIAIGILGFALISGRVQRSIVTAPMVFVTFGFVVARGLGVVELEMEDPLIHTLAELTLVLVLFTDASRIDLGLLRREHDLPVRLLTIGLPMCIVLGGLLAVALFDFGLWEAAVLAAMLAPTDAALGQAVVSIQEVPVRIRQALNVESGLNDGIALPVFLLFLSFAGAAEQVAPTSYWIRFAALQLILGPLVGIAVGVFRRQAGGARVAHRLDQPLVSGSLRVGALTARLRRCRAGGRERLHRRLHGGTHAREHVAGNL